MLTLQQKRALCNLIQDEIQRQPNQQHYWLPVLGEIAQDLRQHQLARQRAKQRNAAKRSRRDQRGPRLKNRTKFASRHTAK